MVDILTKALTPSPFSINKSKLGMLDIHAAACRGQLPNMETSRAESVKNNKTEVREIS